MKETYFSFPSCSLVVEEGRAEEGRVYNRKAQLLIKKRQPEYVPANLSCKVYTNRKTGSVIRTDKHMQDSLEELLLGKAPYLAILVSSKELGEYVGFSATLLSRVTYNITTGVLRLTVMNNENFSQCSAADTIFECRLSTGERAGNEEVARLFEEMFTSLALLKELALSLKSNGKKMVTVRKLYSNPLYKIIAKYGVSITVERGIRPDALAMTLQSVHDALLFYHTNKHTSEVCKSQKPFYGLHVILTKTAPKGSTAYYSVSSTTISMSVDVLSMSGLGSFYTYDASIISESQLRQTKLTSVLVHEFGHALDGYFGYTTKDRYLFTTYRILEMSQEGRIAFDQYVMRTKEFSHIAKPVFLKYLQRPQEIFARALEVTYIQDVTKGAFTLKPVATCLQARLVPVYPTNEEATMLVNTFFDMLPERTSLFYK